uniref:Uncharacterized protein n=1 Tax=Timema douglasi TaxID=61478 RepID=A0A7R8VIU8_TIMDO|nr:unnamed protein product [Timema douglasi]
MSRSSSMEECLHEEAELDSRKIEESKSEAWRNNSTALLDRLGDIDKYIMIDSLGAYFEEHSHKSLYGVVAKEIKVDQNVKSCLPFDFTPEEFVWKDFEPASAANALVVLSSTAEDREIEVRISVR